MKDLLENIGATAREAQKDDALLERIASGDADVGEHEAARPLDSAALDRIADAVAPAPKKALAPVVSIWKRRAVMFAGPLALAAVMVLYFTAGTGPTAPTMPSYVVSATSEKEMRGDTPVAARLHLGPKANDKDARFTIVLTPETAPTSKVVAYAFVGGEPLDAKVETSAQGAIRISGASRKLEGMKELRIVVGPPASIGKFDDAMARAQNGKSDSTVRVLVVPIDRD